MPNLDAEVLNEPKKQIVKDFNKEEIVQIIQNAINKRILDLGDIGGGSGENLDINLANYCTDEELLALIGCVTGESATYPAGHTISFSGDGIAIDYDKVDKVTLHFDVQTGVSEILSAKAVLYKSSLVRATNSLGSLELKGYFGTFSFNSGEKNIVSYLQLGTSFETNTFNHLEYVSTTPKEVVPVVANPEVGGAENPLTALQVGDTKYSVGGGSLHCYRIECKVSTSYDTTGFVYLFIEEDLTPSYANIAQYLYNKGYTSSSSYCKSIIYVPGRYKPGETMTQLDGIRSSGGTSIQLQSSYFLTLTISDNVISSTQAQTTGQYLRDSAAVVKIF